MSFKFKAITSSVSGAAVIGGIFLIALDATVVKGITLTLLGALFVVLGVGAAVAITKIIRG